MNKWVSPVQKRNFLKWFLENQQLKRSEARKVIEYIINNFHILENVFFTEKMRPRRKTLIFSSVNSDEPGFLFYNNERKTEEISEALGNLMMNPSEKVNIIIHFSGKMTNYRYLQLIEIPLIENIKQYERFEKYSKVADDVFGEILLEQEIEMVKKQIDDALDQKDEDLFRKLTARLAQYNAKKHNH